MGRKLWGAVTMLVGGAALSGCVDERIVFVERPLFDTPPAAAADFVGYSNPDTKLTVCGNCHISFQRQWRETAHADAWTVLQGLGAGAVDQWGLQHSTNQLGNPIDIAGGWATTKAARYQDVQCESCHGPSLNHITGPSRNNWPLAAIGVGEANAPQGCSQCHSGGLYPYHEEWARSAHGRIPAAGSQPTSPSGREACWGCHTGEDAMIMFGVRAAFAEKATHVGNPAANLGITCAVCHDPHRADVPGQLRFAIDVPREEDNLCMQCHHKRGTPDFTTFRGPHSPEGPTLLGYAGAWIGRMEFPDTIVATHGSARNPRLCAGCHVNMFESTDPVTGATVRSTGHTFDATPCVDASGLPVPGPCPDTQRSYRTCTDVGCHATEQVARSLEARAAERVLRLTDELSQLLQLAHRSGGRTDNWWNCRGTGNCPDSPLHWGAGQPTANWTVALSAAWNFELVRRTTGGGGALRQGQLNHNPVLIEVLLLTSIREMRREYNLSAQSNVSLQRELGTGTEAVLR
jgi:predicted CXXCH cytochrome family protein